MSLLLDETGLMPEAIIADVGAGTGILTEQLLARGYRVAAVEPNAAMRAAAERRLSDYPAFSSVNGRAEEIPLPDESVDLVVAAQAFHWFDSAAARAEFARILRPPRHVALIWNRRRLTGSGFMEAYESFLTRFGTDYAAVRHDRVTPESLAAFYKRGYRRHLLYNEQRLDRSGLVGRVRSSSYAPKPDDAEYPAMLSALNALFDEHSEAGEVCIIYDVEIYLGTVAPP